LISYTFVRIPILSHWSILENVVVIDMSVYMSVAERHKCIFYIATVATVDTPYMEKSGKSQGI